MKPSRRHAQIHLPPLDAGYALTLIDIFQRAIDAIWRAHGDRMAQLSNLRAPAQRRRNSEHVDCGNPDAPVDVDS
jgi:hypothetical protein